MTSAQSGRLSDLSNGKGVYHASQGAPVSHLANVREKSRTEGLSEEAAQLLGSS